MQHIHNVYAGATALQICIPKYSSCVRQSITEADVKDHVLFADNVGQEEEEAVSLYKTLSRKVILSLFRAANHCNFSVIYCAKAVQILLHTFLVIFML